jgi:hypothetical protein
VLPQGGPNEAACAERIKAHRVMHPTKEVGAMKFLVEWQEDRGVEWVGPYFEGVEPEDRWKWAVQLVMDYYDVYGKRAEQVKGRVAELKAAFKSGGGDHGIWDHHRVKNMIATCRRTIKEVRKYLVDKAAKEKYDVNMGMMFRLREETGGPWLNWEANPPRVEVDRAILYILACMLFDFGLRKSNSAGKAPKKPEKRRKGEDEDIGLFKEEETEVPDDTHAQRLGDWEFLVKDPLDGSTSYVRGGRRLGRLLRRFRNSAFLSGRVVFPTTKTMAASKGELKPASWEKRTPLEREILELFLNYLRWMAWRMEMEEWSEVFRRPPVEPGGEWKTVRPQDLATLMKGIAVGAGVAKSHASLVSFRKGNVSTYTLLNRHLQLIDDEGMVKIIRRAGQWVEGSRVPRAHYLHRPEEDRGPFALVRSWEEALELGGDMDVWVRRQGAGRVDEASVEAEMKKR